MKTIYIKTITISIFMLVHAITMSSQSNTYQSGSPVTSSSSQFTLIEDSSGSEHGQQWRVRAFESPDEFRIYITNLYGLFDPQGELRSWRNQLSFRVSIEGKGIQVVYDKTKNPEEGGYGPAGGFGLPLQMAQELWPKKDNNGRYDNQFIDPIQITDNEILLVVPKYKSGSRLYDWWHRRNFIVSLASND